MIKIRANITFLFLVLNLIQLVSGNTFIICKENGYSQELEVITPHDSHEHSGEHHGENENRIFHFDENDCNSCDDLYFENSVNHTTKRTSEFFLNYTNSLQIKDINLLTLRSHFSYNKIHADYIKSTLYFPIYTVLLV